MLYKMYKYVYNFVYKVLNLYVHKMRKMLT